MPAAAERFVPPQACVIVAPEAAKIEIVSKLSTMRKLGVVARVAAQQAGRSRTLSAVMKAVTTTARSFGRVLHQLWLEVIGVVFLAMAGIGGIHLAREYTKYETGHTGPSRLVAAICFTLVFAWFGVSSFWRVRRKG